MRSRMEERFGLTNDGRLPGALRPFHGLALRAMGLVNGFAHLILGLALAASVVLFTVLFVDDVLTAIRQDNLTQGFLHGLASLMLLWTISALITAEIRYLRGHALTVDTFVEVAIVVTLRKLITTPVHSAAPSPQDIFITVAAAALLGVMYLVLRYAQTLGPKPDSRADEARADVDRHGQNGIVVEERQYAMQRRQTA